MDRQPPAHTPSFPAYREDTFVFTRQCRKAWQKEAAVQYTQEKSGGHFDPEVVKAFLAPTFKRE